MLYPKYIVKRMIPNEAIRVTPNGMEISIINVFSPGKIDEIPENDIEKQFEIRIDGIALTEQEKSQIYIEIEGKKGLLSKLKQLEGLTFSIGSIIKITIPKIVVKSTQHDFSFQFNTNRPIEIQFQRTVM
jgi:hypothetical protein